ncbi:hypothetical protein [Mesorhizobium sp. M1399]|uniref:hypothetical protein n=1 Tax=Mesorhizobium sp. M1399 TaxID=2957096 RepID=UPI00333B37E5
MTESHKIPGGLLRVEFQPRHRIALPRTAEIEAHKQRTVWAAASRFRRLPKGDFRKLERGLYRTEPPAVEEVKVGAVPHFAWHNRDPGEMLVWLRSAG